MAIQINGINGHSHKVNGTTNGHVALPNIALHVTRSHEIYQAEVSYPACKPTECIVRVRCTGICGSEIHFWKAGHIGDYAVEEDLILGHESAGEVISVGSDVRHLQPGDRVSIEPGVSCMACEQCISGRYNLCPIVRFSGTPPTNGTLSRYIAHPAAFLHKLPPTVSYSLGALVEPLSVAIAGLQKADVRLGTPTLVCGAGPIGLCAVVCLRAAGAFPIIVTDLAPNRLDFAISLGAHAAVQAGKATDPRTMAAEVRAAMHAVHPGAIPTVALECTGAEASIFTATYALQEGGILCQIGNGRTEQMMPLQAMSMREIDYRGVFRYTRTWPLILRLYHAGLLNGIEKMVTHSLPIHQTKEAFAIAADINAGALKVQITDDE